MKDETKKRAEMMT